MTRTAGKRNRSTSTLQPRAKVWLEVGGKYVFGHGLNEILRAIDEQGSIKQAAKSLGKSYRYVWQRLKEAEDALQLPLVDAHVGGAGTQRSTLTPKARDWMRAFTSLRAKVFALVEREFAARFSR